MNIKNRWVVIILIILFLLILIPTINAMDNKEQSLDFTKKSDQETSELMGWKMILANADTGEIIEINSKEEKVLVTQSVPKAARHTESDEKKYYYETIAKIPNEKIDVDARGSLHRDEQYDEKNTVEVSLGIYYSVGYYGVYNAIRYDGIDINFNVNDADVKLSNIETGYIIKNGIGIENGVINKNNCWYLDAGMKNFEGEKFAASPWIIREKNFLDTRIYFSGTLTRENGETWDTMIIMENRI